MTPLIDERYPPLAAWLMYQGWIEIGQDEFSSSFIQVVDPRAMVWEDGEQCASLDKVLAVAEDRIVPYTH